MIFDEVIYPKSDFTGPDGVRINIIIGYSTEGLFHALRRMRKGVSLLFETFFNNEK